ncbi:ATP-grasp domain-containing protein OS=Streptomyces violarus OX=67380 GN=FHS41_007564 PE=4 SV=1 [Streptomyces violarus]
MIAELHDVSERVMRQIGMDSATFSIEYFYDPKTQSINLLEINPRHSPSHAELFQYVDGIPNHHCMVSLALGEDPRMPWQRRIHDGGEVVPPLVTNGVVRRVPGPEEIARYSGLRQLFLGGAAAGVTYALGTFSGRP